MSETVTKLSSEAQACIASLTYNETIEMLRVLHVTLNPGEPLHQTPAFTEPMTSRQIIKEALYKHHMQNNDELNLMKMINRVEYRTLLPHYIVSCMIDYPDDDPLLGLDCLRQMMYKSLFFSLDAGYVKAACSVILETAAVHGFHNRTKIMYDRFCQLCTCIRSKPYKYVGGEKMDAKKLIDISGLEDLETNADAYHITCHVDKYLRMDILPDDDE